jgi:hypothetical protein
MGWLAACVFPVEPRKIPGLWNAYPLTNCDAPQADMVSLDAFFQEQLEKLKIDKY